ncbi:MAG TPA: hypothetical protein DCF68_11745 [Cyanothece sp. UBA12306]|nr:hypothetical protein [Cyanothece sp. UBA12306]
MKQKNGTPYIKDRPYPILPNCYIERLQRQKGRFTIHGRDTRPLEEQFERGDIDKFLGKIVLKKKAIEKAHEILQYTNLNAFTLFPDIEGRAEFVRKEVLMSSEKSMMDEIHRKLKEILEEDKKTLEQHSSNLVHLDSKGVGSCIIDKEHFICRKKERAQLIDWLCNYDDGSRCKFISGEAGFGKTNFLLKFALDWLDAATLVENFNKDKELIRNEENLEIQDIQEEQIEEKSLLFLSLSSLITLCEKNKNDENSLTLEEAIYNHIFNRKVDSSEYDPHKAKMNKDYKHKMSTFKTMFRNGEIALILDGLGELAQGNDNQFFKKLKSELRDLIDSSKKSKLIISCSNHVLKYFGIEEIFYSLINQESKGKDLIKIKPFDSGEQHKQVREKIEEIFSNAKNQLDEPLDEPFLGKLIEYFISESKQNPSFYGLLMNMDINKKGDNHVSGGLSSFLKLIKKNFDENNNNNNQNNDHFYYHVCYKSWIKAMVRESSNQEESYDNILKIAKIMLDQRSEFIKIENIKNTDNDNSLKEFIKRNDLDQEWGIFIQEIQNEFAFSQHSIREFVIADLISEDIKRKKFQVLATHSTFDYEGPEIYEHLTRLISFKELTESLKDVLSFKSDCFNNQSGNWTWREWNNTVRNLFEFLGVIAEVTSQNKGQFVGLIDLSLKLLNQTRHQGFYISYRTKYDIVRFLERIHPSSPQPYYGFIFQKKSSKVRIQKKSSKARIQKKSSKARIQAYAVRGFHKSELQVGIFPSMRFKQDRGLLKDQEKRVCETLINLINQVNDKQREEELTEGANFLRVNCSFALIRWFPEELDDDMLNKVKNILEALKEPYNHCRYTQTNIFYMLYRRYRYRQRLEPDFCGYFPDVKIDEDLELASRKAKKKLSRLQRPKD